MELTAVLEAVRSLEGPLAIHSDSTYVVNCFNDRWYEGWKARGWKNTQKKPVANRDLWEPLIELYLARSEELTFTWVKGHAGEELNEIADQMAVAEVERLRNRLPAEPGGGDAAPTSAPWPAEQAIVVSGARELDDEQRAELVEALAGLDGANDVIVSGLRLGAELEGAEVAIEQGVPLGVVLPYPDPVRVWSPSDRARFDRAVEAAEWVVTLDGDPSAPGPSIKARNGWLMEVSVGAIIVGDEAMATEAENAGLGVIAL
jgi:hypothetical protein